MIEAPIPYDESGRIRSVYSLGILDTPPEERFDRITRAAVILFNVPISTITIIDSDREWYKSCQGLATREKDRAISFCGHAVVAPEPLIIPDASKDERFADNPMVTGDPHIRFYAGVPLKAGDGRAIGVFCIKDTKPRTLSVSEVEALTNFAKWAELEINSEQLSIALLQRAELEDRLLLEKQSLAQEKATDEAILQNIGDGLVVVDKDRKIVMANRVILDATGYAITELLGQRWPECVTPVDDRGRPYNEEDYLITQVFEKKQVVSSPVYKPYYYTLKNGKTVPVSATVSPININNGIQGAVIVIRDVSREIAIDRAKSEFVSLASHQLRTPLSTISWYTELLLDGDAGQLTDDQRSFLNEIYHGNQRMISLVNSLLNVSRIEMGTFSVEPTLLDLRVVTHEMVVQLDPICRNRGVEVKEEYPVNMPEVLVDPQLMSIIIQNVLTNAIKYSQDSSIVEVRLHENDQAVVLSVSDHGMGIPDNQRDKIFSKLFRADNAREVETDGTGLGLYIVKSILDQTGGKIWFESKVNVGSTFYIELPKKGMEPIKGVTTLNTQVLQ